MYGPLIKCIVTQLHTNLAALHTVQQTQPLNEDPFLACGYEERLPSSINKRLNVVYKSQYHPWPFFGIDLPEHHFLLL
jgi:hypothetical protein